jgi:hypothetical protein
MEDYMKELDKIWDTMHELHVEINELEKRLIVVEKEVFNEKNENAE